MCHAPMRKDTDMATAEYYCQTWIFNEASGFKTVTQAYPLGNTVTIGKQIGGKFMLAWADLQDVLHVLGDLTLDVDGCLVGSPSGTMDLYTGSLWAIKISAKEELRQIRATVSPINCHDCVEGNLTGAWGAETPPRPYGSEAARGQSAIIAS